MSGTGHMALHVLPVMVNAAVMGLNVILQIQNRHRFVHILCSKGRNFAVRSIFDVCVAFTLCVVRRCASCPHTEYVTGISQDMFL